MSGPKRPLRYADVIAYGRTLPEVEEGTSYGTPALKVRGKLFVRLKEDGETVVLRTDPDEREYLLHHDPEVFSITPHYIDYPWVLALLPAMSSQQMREMVLGAWRRAAPRTVVKRFDSRA
jgi:hypothetical protein